MESEGNRTLELELKLKQKKKTLEIVVGGFARVLKRWGVKANKIIELRIWSLIMNHFIMRKACFSFGKRIIAIGVGSGLYCGVLYCPDLKTTMKLSVPALWDEQFSLQVLPSVLSSEHWRFGNFPLFLSRVAPPPAGDSSKEATATVEDGLKPSFRDFVADAAAKVAPAVVHLSVRYEEFYGLSTRKSMGSGTIIDSDGTILTCAHVVVETQGRRGASKGKVEVTLQDGRTFEGTVVNADIHSDIAIVKINSKTPLPTARVGCSSKLRPGDWVIALGCPHSLQNTITAGIASCVDRKSSDLGLGGVRREYLQTDCAINPGNSGGPLVNVDGEIIGVNILKVVTSNGLSFSVPIDSMSKIMQQFKKNGRVIRPWLGLKMLDLNDMIIAQLKERDTKFPDVEKGILVTMVTPDSPTARAGFHPGDVVTEFDGKQVQSIKEIVEIMDDRIGQPLEVVVKRANDEVVKFTVIPEEANPKETNRGHLVLR